MVLIKGKEYATVAERLTAAHGDEIRPVGIKSILTQAFDVGARVVVRATVDFGDGRAFSGLAEVIETASGAQATNPLECAETSAVGRALAMAGYFGSGDGLAGAEEIGGGGTQQARPPARPAKPMAKPAAPTPPAQSFPQTGVTAEGPPALGTPPAASNGQPPAVPLSDLVRQYRELAGKCRAQGIPENSIQELHGRVTRELLGPGIARLEGLLAAI